MKTGHNFMRNAFQSRFSVAFYTFLAFTVPFFMGCGGGGDSPGNTQQIDAQSPPQASQNCQSEPLANNKALVAYENTSLFVYGVEYKASATPLSNYQPGGLIVYAQKGRPAEALALFNALHLRVLTTYDALDGFFVEVPCGFEAQWIAALSAQPDVLSAHLNGLYQTQ